MTTLPPQLDVLAVPLTGVQVVEASAGTGKTRAITQLYLRLVVETGLSVDRILVVTYTVAATEELRERVHGLLTTALAAARAGHSDDELCAALVRRTSDRAEMAQRLQHALWSFDQAAIHTIHGFCQRVLADAAFESGLPFEVELEPDDQALVEEVVADFWRTRVYPVTPAFARFLLDRGLDPAALVRAIRPHLATPDLAVLVPAPIDDEPAREAALADAHARARALWAEDRAGIEEVLRSPGLKQNLYKPASIALWLRRMESWLCVDTPALKPPKEAKKFRASELMKSWKQKEVPRTHPFFAAMDDLAEAVERLAEAYKVRLRRWKGELLRGCRPALDERKRARRTQSFDDLLLRLRTALEGPGGGRLADGVRARWGAALIDEFQDTDPVQWAIFRRVYGGGTLPMVLVGDPKQAIYSFRGADVFTYLAARAEASVPGALARNWRSRPALVRGLNALFARAEAPFVLDDIPFRPADADAVDTTRLVVAGEADAPLRFWLLEREPGETKLVAKAEATRRAAQATAAEIARLLDLGARGAATLGGRPLAGRDIAVLVRKHRQGQLVRLALARLGVPSVQLAEDSVFTTREAEELERVLLAVAQPGREDLVRAALATEMLGGTGGELFALLENDTQWATRVEAFHAHQETWRERGFARMIRGLLADEGVPARLLAHPDGERRLTNVLHLGELLQAEAARGERGLDALVVWMAERRRAGQAERAEQQLRLESDDPLVKIVTIHKSKGLQYPIVFCPFLWDGRLFAESAPDVVAHDPVHGAPQLEVDADRTPPSDHRTRACLEELAENVRLLYVALTRAEQRCTVVWGAANDAPTSALAWLLHPPPAEARSMLGLRKHVLGLSDDALRGDLIRLVTNAHGAVSVEPLPPTTAGRRAAERQDARPLAPRVLARAVPAGWRVASFTALAAGAQTGESPDHDAGRWLPPVDDAALAASDILAFPRGARAGTCLHAIFETLDFADDDPARRAADVESGLRRHGVDPGWTPAVVAMLDRVLAASFDGDGRVRLAGLPRTCRLDELEFTYPVERLEMAELGRLLAAHGATDALEGLDFPRLQGLLRGFIDVVVEGDGRWWLADYKSNWLGAERADYTPARLGVVMTREAYHLQYLLYTVALHRLLRLRLPGYDYDAHVGGVAYLFLRGIDVARDPDCGVFRTRPSRALVEALDGYLAGR